MSPCSIHWQLWIYCSNRYSYLSPLSSLLSPLPSPLSPLLPFVLLLIIDSAISRLLNTDATAYWLIKIEILETLSKINYAVLHYLEQSPYNRAFHPVDQTHKGSSRSLQARVLDRILLSFGEKEERRERGLNSTKARVVVESPRGFEELTYYSFIHPIYIFCTR